MRLVRCCAVATVAVLLLPHVTSAGIAASSPLCPPRVITPQVAAPVAPPRLKPLPSRGAESTSARIAALERELAETRARLDRTGGVALTTSYTAPSSPTYPQTLPVASAPRYTSGGGYSNPGPLPIGWFVGYESVIARPFFTTNQFGLEHAPVAFHWDYEYSPRILAGYAGPGGLGARVRYWQWDHHADPITQFDHFSGNFVTETSSLRVETLDFDVTQRLGFRLLQLNFVGGVRYASFHQDPKAYMTVPQGDYYGHSLFNLQFYGAGPSVAIELFRPVIGGFSLYASARESLLYGNTRRRLNDSFLPANIHEIEVGLLPITELQLGGQWWFNFTESTAFFVRAGVEAQVWQNIGNVAPSSALFGSGELLQGDAGFFGITAATGVVW